MSGLTDKTIYGTDPIPASQLTEDEKFHVLTGEILTQIGRLQPSKETWARVVDSLDDWEKVATVSKWAYSMRLVLEGKEAP